jgi:hypothetical protein
MDCTRAVRLVFWYGAGFQTPDAGLQPAVILSFFYVILSFSEGVLCFSEGVVTFFYGILCFSEDALTFAEGAVTFAEAVLSFFYAVLSFSAAAVTFYMVVPLICIGCSHISALRFTPSLRPPPSC